MFFVDTPQGRFQVKFTYYCQLLKQGYVRGSHLCRNDSRVKTVCEVSLVGKVGQGITSRTIFEGTSYCNPGDNFSKVIGRQISLKRALDQVADPTVCESIWSEYFKQHSDNRKKINVLTVAGAEATYIPGALDRSAKLENDKRIRGSVV